MFDLAEYVRLSTSASGVPLYVGDAQLIAEAVRLLSVLR